jgi:predicted nucleic acid-binding protein
MREKDLPVLFDTDVLIWYFRGLDTAAELISKTPYEQRFVSSVCIMELIQGCRNKKELKDIMAFIGDNCHIIHCDNNVSEKAISLIQIYALSHGLRTVDAIIAATVLVNKACLATANYRHFDMIESVRLIRFNPNLSRLGKF